MHLRKIDCQDGRWLQLAQDFVQWWVLVIMVLNLQVITIVFINYQLTT